jgi:hypothetical protein
MKEKYTTYEREMELLVGALASVRNTEGWLATAMAQRLNKILAHLREHPDQFTIEDTIMRKTYQIELKIDFEDGSRHKIALHLMRKAARNIVAQANLISDGRDPQVAFSTDDFFEGGTQESLAELSEIPEDAGDGNVPSEE